MNTDKQRTNRIIASRNKREGGYLGYYVSVYDDVPNSLLKRRHHRKGRWYWPTLRDNQRAEPWEKL